MDGRVPGRGGAGVKQPPPEPILVSGPGEEPVYALVCLIKGSDLQELEHRLSALRPPRSEYLVVLAEKLASGELVLAYHDTYQGQVLTDIEASKRMLTDAQQRVIDDVLEGRGPT